MPSAKRLWMGIVTVVVGCAYQVAVLSAQTCGDVEVNSQAEADAFNCATVEGTLRISGEDITHLAGLSELTEVWGFLSIGGNAALRNLAGLSALTAVRGSVVIDGNAALTQFCGLFPLLEVDGIGGDILIDNNGIAITEADILAAGPCI